MNKTQIEKALKLLNKVELEEQKEVLELKDILYTELNKVISKEKGTKVNLFSFVKKFVKQKHMRDYLKGVICQEGRYFLCDGYRIIELDEKPEGIKEVEGMKCIDLMENTSGNMIDLELTSKEIELKCRTAEKFVIFEKDGMQHGFNPKYLLDFIKLNGDSMKLKLSIRQNHAAYIEGNYPGILLPIRL